MKEIKKKKSKPDPQILIPVIVGAVCVLMVAAVIIFMNPENTTAGQLQKKLELGDKYLESGDYEKAELAFQEALKIDEKSPDATIKLADTYNKMKKPEKALKMLEQTNKNLENMSVSQLNSNPDGWKNKMNMYETVYKQTEQLYENSGNQMPADTSEDVINIFNDIHIYINDYVTPTPKPAKKPGKKEDKKDTTPVPEQEGEPTVTPEETPAPDITVTPEEDQEKEPTVTPEVSPEATVTPSSPDAEVTPEAMADPTETPIPGDWTVIVKPDQTPTPKPDMNAEPEPQPEPNPELQPEPAPETPQDPSGDTGIPPAVPDGSEDTGIPPAVPDYPEEQPVPPADQNNAEMPPENQDSQTEQDAPAPENTPDQILDAFAAEFLAASPRTSLGTPVSYTYGDESGMAAASGTLGAEKRDFNGDGMPELLVISARNGQLVLDTYTAAGGTAVMVSSVDFEECFGKAVEGVTYGGTQTCFIRENGSGFDIGMAGYYFGMNTGDGNPGAKTVAALYTMGADGSLNMSASASLINGIISSPQEGGKDGFISALSGAGMSGSWVSESADVLAGMDLANNPVQDMAGVPNPLGGGLAGKEPGVQDLVVVNAGMQPGTGSMNFSVTDNTTCGK